VDEDVAKIARELVRSIRATLELGGIDWTSRESMRAEMRRTIKRLLRKHRYVATTPRDGGGGPPSLDELTSLILEQARALYANWPQIWLSEICLSSRASSKGLARDTCGLPGAGPDGVSPRAARSRV
jgi:hypothetical protein